MKDKVIMNITECFHRSLILSVIAGIINSICYDLVLEVEQEREELLIRQIPCDKVYRICDNYIAERSGYIEMYPVFLQFVKYINIHDREISYINYINMELKKFRIYDSVIHSGVIQEIQTDHADICNAHFISVQINDVVFKNGIIEMSSFKCCSFTNVTFTNIHFYNVSFDILLDANIKFVACTFSETVVENYIHDGSAKQLELENKEPVDIIL